jgi:hypothetical protein
LIILSNEEMARAQNSKAGKERDRENFKNKIFSYSGQVEKYHNLLFTDNHRPALSTKKKVQSCFSLPMYVTSGIYFKISGYMNC